MWRGCVSRVVRIAIVSILVITGVGVYTDVCPNGRWRPRLLDVVVHVRFLRRDHLNKRQTLTFGACRGAFCCSAAPPLLPVHPRLRRCLLDAADLRRFWHLSPPDRSSHRRLQGASTGRRRRLCRRLHRHLLRDGRLLTPADFST